MCGKFGLLGHIDGTITSRPTDPTWNQPDACVRSWMYGSVSDGVLDLAIAPYQTTRALYTAISDLFQANQEPRAVILNQEFASLSQGDLPIEAYASQLKQTADALRDVGHPILDRQLVLNLLNGINPRLANTADIIANARPLPTFTEAVNMLRLKELRLANDNKVASNTALTASTTAACTSASCRSTSSTASQLRSSGGGKGKGKGKGGNSGSSNGGGGSGRKQQQQQTGQGSQGGARGGPQPAGPWVCFNLWAWGPQQQWRPPMAPLPQAHTAFHHRRCRLLRRRPPATLRQVARTRRVSLPP